MPRNTNTNNTSLPENKGGDNCLGGSLVDHDDNDDNGMNMMNASRNNTNNASAGEISFVEWMSTRDLPSGNAAGEELELPLGGSAHINIVVEDLPPPTTTTTSEDDEVEEDEINEGWFTDEDGDMFASPRVAMGSSSSSSSSNEFPTRNNINEGSLSSFGLPVSSSSDNLLEGSMEMEMEEDDNDDGDEEEESTLNWNDDHDDDSIATGPLNDVVEVEVERPKSIRFASVIATPILIPSTSTVISMAWSADIGGSSVHSNDKCMSYQKNGFDEESEGSMDIGIKDIGMKNDAGDELLDDDEIDPEEDEDAKIKRSLMFAAGGMGAMALAGWGMGKIKQLFERGGDGEEDDVAAAAQHQVTGDGARQSVQDVSTSAMTGDPTSTATMSASTANASQSQSFFAVGVMPGDGGVGMLAAQ
jgi:hypothetical protein